MIGIYTQRGETIDFINNTENTILPGEIVEYGKRYYIAGCKIEKGELGTLHTIGVFQMPCEEAGTVSPGDEIYYGDSGVKVGQGTGKVGICVEAMEKTVAAGDYILVMLQ